MRTLALPLPISQMLLRRFFFEVIDPGLRVNLCEILCGTGTGFLSRPSQVADIEFDVEHCDPDVRSDTRMSRAGAT
jgi:hypothetical protein